MPPMLTEASVNKDSGTKGAEINFSVRVHDGDSGVDNSKVTAVIHSPSEDLLSTVDLYDDGSHGDKCNFGKVGG